MLFGCFDKKENQGGKRKAANEDRDQIACPEMRRRNRDIVTRALFIEPLRRNFFYFAACSVNIHYIVAGRVVHAEHDEMPVASL